MKFRRLIIFASAAVVAAAVFVFASCDTEISGPLEIYPVKAPEAGNYPQSLYKYPFVEKAAKNNIPYTQTIEWSPAVSKTFAINTQYTAKITLEPKGSSSLFKDTEDYYSISGLPTAGVESITSKADGKNLVISIVFEKTGSANTPAKILFEDDFNGASLDTGKWTICPGEDRQGRSRWEADMISVNGGNLRIKFENEPSRGSDWIRSGAVQTRKLPTYSGSTTFENSYGYYEARIKFPVVRGTWGAFWLMTTTMGQTRGNGGIGGTEIDIIESIGNEEGKYNSAYHWDGYGEDHKGIGSDEAVKPVDIYDGEFHIFALDWSPSEYIFYVDNKEFWRSDGGPRFNNSGILQNPNYIIFSVEGADWAGPLPADFTEDEMLVDWVRVWNQPKN